MAELRRANSVTPRTFCANSRRTLHHDDSRLLTADGYGWVVSWNLATLSTAGVLARAVEAILAISFSTA